MESVERLDEDDPFGYRDAYERWTDTLLAWYHERYIRQRVGAELLAIDIANIGMSESQRWQTDDPIHRYNLDGIVVVEVGGLPSTYPAAQLTQAQIEAMHTLAAVLARRAIEGWHADDADARVDAIHHTIRADDTQLLKLLGVTVGTIWTLSRDGSVWLAELKVELADPAHP